MADITASMVKELREKTGAGMMDAKNALTENKGDMEAAVDWLRKKGLSKAAKKSGRTAAEGLVALVIDPAGETGALVEVNSETDFVARNTDFQDFVKKTAEIVLKSKDPGNLQFEEFGNGKNVGDTLTNLIAVIGENMNVRRASKMEMPKGKGVVIGYVHGALAPGLGKIAVLVGLESEGKKEVLEAAAKKIAMHVAAANPQFLDIASVDPGVLEREKNVLAEQTRASGKGEDMIPKIVEGRLRKFYEEICLVEQILVLDGETKISKLIESTAKEAGAPVKLSGYKRFQLGEGIEVEKEDFAAEVAKAANG